MRMPVPTGERMDAVARPRSSSSSLTSALLQLHHQLQSTPLRLDLPDAAALRAERDEMVEQLGDYVLPRMLQQDAPLLAVVGGSTGAALGGMLGATGNYGPLFAVSAALFVPLTAVSAVTRRRYLRTRRGR